MVAAILLTLVTTFQKGKQNCGIESPQPLNRKQTSAANHGISICFNRIKYLIIRNPKKNKHLNIYQHDYKTTKIV